MTALTIEKGAQQGEKGIFAILYLIAGYTSRVSMTEVCYLVAYVDNELIASRLSV